MRSSSVACTLAGIILLAGLLAGASGSAETMSILDEETVFCAYFSLSGERPSDRDVEDLCWTLGRPTFSSFKPSEMFSGKDRQAVKRRLNGRISEFDPEDHVRWELTGKLKRRAGQEHVSFQTVPKRVVLPQATDLIGAEMAKGGWRRLRKALRTLPAAIGGGAGQDELRLYVLLRPERTEQRMETRNIAQEAVSIPVRFVLFRPVAVDTGSTAEAIRIPVAP